MVTFYDAVTPANIPDGARACLYSDGDFKASSEETRRLGPVRWITVEGGVAAALTSGCADFEPKNPVHDVAGRLQDWADGRRGMNARARVYCNRSDFPRAWDLVGANPAVVFWIATLDSHAWGAEELLADIAANEKLELPLAKLWGCQYEGGMTAKFDVSLLYGVW